MIHQETWYREASQEKELSTLLRDFGMGDDAALMKFLILLDRNPSGEGWNKCRKKLSTPLMKAIRGYFTVNMNLDRALQLEKEVRVPLQTHYYRVHRDPPGDIQSAMDQVTACDVDVAFNLDVFTHSVLRICDKNYGNVRPDPDEVFGEWGMLKHAVKSWLEALEDLQKASEGILKTGSGNLEEEFNRAVREYQSSGDNGDLLRVVQLSMRSGSGLPGIRSDVQVKARGLLLEKARGEMQEALSDDFSYRMEEALPALLGKIGPHLYVKFTGGTKRQRREPIIVRLYPHTHLTLERGEPIISLSNIQNGHALGINFNDYFTVGELIDIFSSKGIKR